MRDRQEILRPEGGKISRETVAVYLAISLLERHLPRAVQTDDLHTVRLLAVLLQRGDCGVITAMDLPSEASYVGFGLFNSPVVDSTYSCLDLPSRL